MWIKNRVTAHGRKGRLLRRYMKNAESFEDWKKCAEELDRVNIHISKTYNYM
jgi:hypothetical protein